MDILNTIIESLVGITRKEETIKLNIKEIPKKEVQKIAFIDGGQAEILKAPNFSLQLIRTSAVIFENIKRLKTVRNESFLLITAKEENGLKYETKFFGSDEKEIFDPMDSELREGNERIEISKIGNIMRRFAEIKLANEMITTLPKGGILILDGSLKSVIKKEESLIKDLNKKAEENEVSLGALAKTSRSLEKGDSLLGKVARNSQENKFNWYYPAYKEQGIQFYIVRLNSSAEHLFEFSTFGEPETVLSNLVLNSIDQAFPGYPYGLVSADKFARVGNDEKQRILTQIKVKSGASWKNIAYSINALNSHDVLDKMG